MEIKITLLSTYLQRTMKLQIFLVVIYVFLQKLQTYPMSILSLNKETIQNVLQLDYTLSQEGRISMSVH